MLVMHCDICDTPEDKNNDMVIYHCYNGYSFDGVELADDYETYHLCKNKCFKSFEGFCKRNKYDMNNSDDQKTKILVWIKKHLSKRFRGMI